MVLAACLILQSGTFWRVGRASMSFDAGGYLILNSCALLSVSPRNFAHVAVQIELHFSSPWNADAWTGLKGSIPLQTSRPDTGTQNIFRVSLSASSNGTVFDNHRTTRSLSFFGHGEIRRINLVRGDNATEGGEADGDARAGGGGAVKVTGLFLRPIKSFRGLGGWFDDVIFDLFAE